MYGLIIPLFSQLWWKGILLFLAIIVSVPLLSYRLSFKHRKVIANSLGGYLIFSTILMQFKIIALGTWDVSWALPLQYCNVMSFISALAFITRAQRIYEISLFLGLFAPMQGIITPGLAFDIEGYFLWDYFSHHAVIILCPIYLTLIYQMRPRKNSWLKAPLNFFPLVALIYLFDLYVEGNYMFLTFPPPIENPLILGPWPTYLGVWIFFIFALGFITEKGILAFKGKKFS